TGRHIEDRAVGVELYLAAFDDDAKRLTRSRRRIDLGSHRQSRLDVYINRAVLNLRLAPESKFSRAPAVDQFDAQSFSASAAFELIGDRARSHCAPHLKPQIVGIEFRILLSIRENQIHQSGLFKIDDLPEWGRQRKRPAPVRVESCETKLQRRH